MAPVYDVVTTTVYLKNDVPVLSLAGTKKWWTRKMLEQFTTACLSMAKSEAGENMMSLWVEGVREFCSSDPTILRNDKH